MPDVPFDPLPPDIQLPPQWGSGPIALSLQSQISQALEAVPEGKSGVFLAGISLNGELHVAYVQKISDTWTVTGNFGRAENQGWSGGAQVMASW